MDVVLGWTGIAVGSALLLWSLWATVGANAGRRIPYLTNAEVVPRGSMLARAVGIGIFVFAALSLATRFAYWPALVLAVGALLGLVVIARHNRHVGRTSEG